MTFSSTVIVAPDQKVINHYIFNGNTIKQNKMWLVLINVLFFLGSVVTVYLKINQR